jgi:hypothetical protein
LVVLATSVSAHRKDEYLQAARLGVEPDHVDLELDLTPGIAVTDGIIAGLDRDRDGTLSSDEKNRYVGEVFRDVAVEIDGRPLRVGAVESSFPDLDACRRGEGTIQLRSTIALPPLSDGTHRLFFRNTHARDVGVYLANALVPASDRVAISGQQRDGGQNELTIDFVSRRASAASTRVWLFGGIATMVGLTWLYSRRKARGVSGTGARRARPAGPEEDPTLRTRSHLRASCR